MKPFLMLLLVTFFFGCKGNQKEIEVPMTDDQSVEAVRQDADAHPGKLFMESECYVCHNPRTSRANMIAPPMAAIKLHYIDSNTTKEAFTKALIRWVNDPETESKMPGALKRFGCMPYMPHPDEALTKIADYLYDYEVEKPDWFNTHFRSKLRKGHQKGKPKEMAYQNPEKLYAKVGLGYVKTTQAQLGKNLTRAIQENGPVGAIRFCNEEAIKLTDSMSLMHNAVIKRISDKPRNTSNKATNKELYYIASFKKTVAMGGEPSPIVEIQNEEVQFYYPIVTNALCLQCHGKPNEHITAQTRSILKNLYPNDQAVGYDINEVRGMWGIVFDSNNH